MLHVMHEGSSVNLISLISIITSGSSIAGCSPHLAQTVAIADHIATRMETRFGNEALILSTVRP